MLSLLNWNGSPSSTVLSAPTVFSPSLPAVNLLPSSPLISPVMIALAAKALRCQILRIPGGRLLYGAVFDVLAHLVRGAEPIGASTELKRFDDPAKGYLD